MNPFRWKNCSADINTWSHRVTVQMFFDDVIAPSVRALEERIIALEQSGHPGDALIRADTEDVLQETQMAFSLSVQSIWERQLRGYLRDCASELRPGTDLAMQAEKGTWEKLCSLFSQLRGISLEAFPSFAELRTLHLLGNACRHGDGQSATELAQRCPELWRVYPTPFEDQRLRSQPPRIRFMHVPLDRIRRFVLAIVTFWTDAQYIYHESIEARHRHPTLEAQLVRERAERSWRPQASPGDSSDGQD